MKKICLWYHTALNTEINECKHSFPLPLNAYELIPHTTLIIQQYQKNLNIIMGLKPEQHLKKYYDMYNQLQIL